MGTIALTQGDITKVKADAIVNAASTDLLHGGGVAAAIVEAGGNSIQEESSKIAPIPLGEAAITTAGKLDARCVIHAASMELGQDADEHSVASAIDSSFRRAREAGLKSIVFPAVGTGIGRLPMERCADILLRAALRHYDEFASIVFVLRTREALDIFDTTYKRLTQNQENASAS